MGLEALIAYGTYFGATADTAKEIAKVLGEGGFNVKVVDLKEDDVKEISSYDVVVIGSGMRMGNWTAEAEGFLKRFQNDFKGKKIALFISSLIPIEERMGKSGQASRTRKVGLEDKIAKYHVEPVSMSAFGGVVNYNKMGIMMRKAMEMGYKSQLEKYGFKEVQPGVYDLHDWENIRSWARELAQKARN